MHFLGIAEGATVVRALQKRVQAPGRVVVTARFQQDPAAAVIFNMQEPLGRGVSDAGMNNTSMVNAGQFATGLTGTTRASPSPSNSNAGPPSAVSMIFGAPSISGVCPPTDAVLSSFHTSATGGCTRERSAASAQSPVTIVRNSHTAVAFNVIISSPS